MTDRNPYAYGMAAHPAGIRFAADVTDRFARDATNPQEALRQAAIDALHGVPGLSGIQATLGRTGISGRGIVITATGWSPSLHALKQTRSVVFRSEAHADVLAAVPAIADAVARLAARAEDAARLDLDGPIPVQTDSAVLHLHVDSSLAAMTAWEPSCLNGARGGVCGAHDMAAWAAPIGPTVYTGTGRVREYGRPHGAASIRQVGWPFRMRTGDKAALYDGTILQFEAGALPMSVMAAMPGRRMDALLALHPGIDHRRIATADADDLGGRTAYTLTFEPDPVPLATLRIGYGFATG